jgi:hypothetical protein
MKKIIKNSIIFLLAPMVFASCLKTNDLYEGFTDIAPLADIPLSHLSSDTLTVYALDVAPSPDATIDTLLAVHLSAKNHVGDVTFHLGLGTSDPAYVAFMTAHPEYTLMPSNLYTFDSTVIIQNAGVLTTANLPISFKTASVDANGNYLFISNKYVLPIIIKDAGSYSIASNFRMIIMRVLAKNEFDADYTVTGWFFHPTAGRAINTTKHLSTISATAVQGGLGDLGSPFIFNIDNNQAIWVSGPYTSTSSSNGFMTADNPGGTDYSDPSNGGHLPGDATFNTTIYNNTYDPATKTFYLHYGYNASNAAGQNVYTRQIYEKWVRK